ncbi:MAG: DUF2726 domain-containing protein [Pseudomonadota bacterium]
MTLEHLVYIGLACLVLVFIVVFLIIRKRKSAFQYIHTPLMTQNEIEFFSRLQRAVPDLFIFPQVSMGALIKPNMPRKSKDYWPALARVNQKRIDYTICNTDMELICLVELDDRTHDKAADALRDAYLDSAGIPTLRWESKKKPGIPEIQAAIHACMEAE